MADVSPTEILANPNSPEALAAEFGREPREGFHLVRNILTQRVVEEQDGTPFCCSVASEQYFCM